MEESSGRIPTDADVTRSQPTKFHLSDYGYVGSFSIAVAIGVLLIWASVPTNYWVQSWGINHYPSRYWADPMAMPMPNYTVVVTIIVAIGFYIAHSIIASPPPPTLRSIFDECSEELLGITPAKDDYQLFEHLSNIDNGTDTN